MTYTRPFITRRFVAYGGEAFGGDTHRHQLALAVRVVDAVTDTQVEAPLRVFLQELRHIRPLRNQSGLFCFEDVPAGAYTLVVEPDKATADWFYLRLPTGEVQQDGFAQPITLPLPKPPPAPPPDIPWPRMDVTLVPKTSYPFPANATLARGEVTTGAGASPPGAAGVVVSCTYKQIDPQDSDKTKDAQLKTQTDDAGEYVLFFKKLPDKKQEVTVAAVKDGQPKQQQIEIVEGVMRKVGTIHFP